MDELEFSLWCDCLKYPKTTRGVIEKIRSSEPVRNRRSRVGNWTDRYASVRMEKRLNLRSEQKSLQQLLPMSTTTRCLNIMTSHQKQRCAISLKATVLLCYGIPLIFLCYVSIAPGGKNGNPSKSQSNWPSRCQTDTNETKKGAGGVLRVRVTQRDTV